MHEAKAEQLVRKYYEALGFTVTKINPETKKGEYTYGDGAFGLPDFLVRKGNATSGKNVFFVEVKRFGARNTFTSYQCLQFPLITKKGCKIKIAITNDAATRIKSIVDFTNFKRYEKIDLRKHKCNNNVLGSKTPPITKWAKPKKKRGRKRLR